MKRALKILFLTILVFSISWLAVLIAWHSSNRAISVSDVGLYLIALPLGALALLYGGYSLWRRAPAQPHPTDHATAPQLADGAPAATPARQPGAKIALLGSALICAAGTSAAELAESIERADEVLDLDPALRSDDGFPVMTARVGDLDHSELDAWLSSMASEKPREETVRAIALLERVTVECLETLAGERQTGGKRTFELDVRCLASDAWREEEMRLARLRLEHVFDANQFQSSSLTLQSSVAVSQSWHHIEQFMVAAAPHQSPARLMLLLASGSALSATAVKHLEAAGRLFSATNQQGIVPGEAAAALLLSSCEASSALGLPAQALLVAPLFEKVSAAENRRVDHSVLARLIQTGIEELSIERGEIAALVCDGDHPSPRGAEIASAMTEAVSHLDPVAQRASIHARCGDTGAVGPLLALALSSLQTRELGKPVMAAILTPDSLRGISVMMPTPYTIASADSPVENAAEKQS